MGVEALTRVFEYAPHDGMELLVLIALANIADPAGVCWPGHEYLGLYARVKHERNLRQYLRALESTGNIYATRVAHRNLKTIYLVATAMSEEEIEQVLVHSFELHFDDARTIAADMVERQRRAEADFGLPLSELRKNKRREGGPQKRRIERSSKERRIERSPNSTDKTRIERSPNSTDKTRIERSPKEREIGRSSFANKGGSPDPQGGIVGSTKEDQRINSMGHSEVLGRGKSRSDPIMIHHDPNQDPPPPAHKATNFGGVGSACAREFISCPMRSKNYCVSAHGR